MPDVPYLPGDMGRFLLRCAELPPIDSAHDAHARDATLTFYVPIEGDPRTAVEHTITVRVAHIQYTLTPPPHAGSGAAEEERAPHA